MKYGNNLVTSQAFYFRNDKIRLQSDGRIGIDMYGSKAQDTYPRSPCMQSNRYI